MGRGPRGSLYRRNYRCARIERLEPRHLLSASTNLQLTTNPDVQQMPSVAVDPRDANHVVIAYMDYAYTDNSGDKTGYAGIRVVVSKDGGDTWGAPGWIPLPDAFDQGAANPTVVFDNVDHDGDPSNGIQNSVYVSFMAAEFLGDKPPITNPGGGAPRALGFQANNAIFVARSDDGGLTWDSPTGVSERTFAGLIGTFATDDNGGGTTDSNKTILVATLANPNDTSISGHATFVSEMTDSGQTTALKVDISAAAPNASLDVTIDGSKVGTIETNTSGAGMFELSGLSRIEDGASVVIAPAPFDIIPDLAIDTSHTVTTDGKQYNPMYAVFVRFYPSGQFPGEPDALAGSNIIFAVSLDGGTTWEEKTELQPAESPTPVTVIFNANVFTGRGAPVEGVGFDNWAHVTVGPEGDIYVSQFAGGKFVVHRSTDGGESFSHPDLNESSSTLSPFGVNNNSGPPSSLTTDPFRLQSVRAIAADPTRPGTIYVAEATDTSDASGVVLDEADINFARSINFGDDWKTTFQVGSTTSARFVNDDNGGRAATGSDNDVVSSQVMPRLVVGADGTLVLIWYDTRRDPENHLLDVFAAVSTDGGKTFSPNFRVTDNSFDPNDGAFSDALGGEDFFLGDTIGMALANQQMYAAWTDTRQGNQDIFFRRISLAPIPKPPNDRFESNDAASTATDLGQVIKQNVPALAVESGDEDWFRVETMAGGTFTVAASGDRVRLELYDSSGSKRIWPDTGDVASGQMISIPTTANQTYYIRVLADPGAPAGSTSHYALSVEAISANVGAQVFGVQSGALSAGNQLIYAIEVAAPGSLELSLTPGTNAQGNFQLLLLDAKNPNPAKPLKTGEQSGASLRVAMPVVKGQQVYVYIAGEADAKGDFELTFVNLDQLNVPENNTAFFPTSIGPSEGAVADLNLDGAPDIVVSHVGQNIISVLLNNGDGTYQAPREFAVGAFQEGGPFTLLGLSNFHRDLVIANFNSDEDDFPDVMAVNPSSGDVSLLLGNGDGTFRPQRRFDMTGKRLANPTSGDGTNLTGVPFALAVGDLNNDGKIDVVTLDSAADPTAQGTVRFGRGDGTFEAPKFFELPNREVNRTNTIQLVDVNDDGKLDLIERDFAAGVNVVLGNGDGSFNFNPGDKINVQGANVGPGLTVADLDGDGNLDIVTATSFTNKIAYSLQNSDGAFDAPESSSVGQFPVAVVVADFATVNPDGSIVTGVPDGHPDLIVANNGRSVPLASGPAEIVVLPGLVDSSGTFDGFGDPIRLASANGPLDVRVANVNPQDDQVLDVVVVDHDGVLVIYGKQPAIAPNDSIASARDLGTVVHLVQPTLTIVPQNTDDYYRLRVPQEAFAAAGDQVLDFSGGFASEAGAGLVMEVLNTSGQVLDSGERFRIVAHQGEELFVHVFGKPDTNGVRGAGAYTLVINTLPQVASVEALGLLPGLGNQPDGATTSLVLVFQGDQLDATSAENPVNYSVIYLGPDGRRGGGDDQVIQVGAGLSAGSRSAIYDPSRNNVDATSGLSIPTAFRQTVTLLFGNALPSGKYEIDVSANVKSSSFNAEEADLLSSFNDGPSGHPVVSVGSGTSKEGATATVAVPTAGFQFDLNEFKSGTPLLTQFHGDIGALLDALLTVADDPTSVTQTIINQIFATFAPAILDQVGSPITSLFVALFDPVSIHLLDPEGRALQYDLQANQETALANNLPRAFVEVGGNVEVIVIANPSDSYQLRVADVPARGRAAAVYFTRDAVTTFPWTNDLRLGVSSFEIHSPLLAPGSTDLPLPNFLASFTQTILARALPALLPGTTTTTFEPSGARTLLLNENLTRSTSAGAGGPAADSFFGDSLLNESWVRVVERAWDELGQIWEDFDIDVRRDGDAGSNIAPMNGSVGPSLKRVWHMLSEIVDGVFQTQEVPTSAEKPAKTTGRQTDAADANSGGERSRIDLSKSDEAEDRSDFEPETAIGTATPTNAQLPAADELQDNFNMPVSKVRPSRHQSKMNATPTERTQAHATAT